MTFEQAAAQYAQAEAQYRAGQINAAQLQSAAAHCRVTDARGQTWQIDPSTRQWLMWNGHAWTAPAAAASMPAPAVAATARARPSMSALGAGLTGVVPGILIDVLQRWSLYKQDPAAAAGVAAPELLSALLLPLVPAIGRFAALLILLACLAWLCWPVIAQLNETAEPAAKGLQQQMGRGIVGLSLLSMIPRILRGQ